MRPVEPPPSRYLFPDPRRGTGPSGVVCTGGDFAPGTLLAAYRRGIFPWPVGEDFVPWCSPDPRAILALDERPRWSQSVRRALKKPFSVTIDRAFSQVMEACGQRDEGTWITSDLLAGYVALHELGWAHSLEVWNSHTGALAGGIYGIAIGGMFAGESMFHRETDASKVAFATIADRLFDAGYAFLDAQMMTDHLASLGCRPVPRPEFLKRLAEAVARPCSFPE